MAEANVEIVRRIFDAWASNDPDTGFAQMDERIEWHPAEDEPETATLHGKVELQGMFLKWLTAFDDFQTEPIEFIDAGEAVVVQLHITGKLPGSGAEVANDETMVFWLRDGKVAEVREFRTKPEALAAAGVTSEGSFDDE